MPPLTNNLVLGSPILFASFPTPLIDIHKKGWSSLSLLLYIRTSSRISKMTVHYRTFIEHIPKRYHVIRSWEECNHNEQGLHIRRSINKLPVKIRRRDECYHAGDKQGPRSRNSLYKIINASLRTWAIIIILPQMPSIIADRLHAVEDGCPRRPI